jgi:hypothetical protein
LASRVSRKSSFSLRVVRNAISLFPFLSSIGMLPDNVKTN